VVDQARCTWYNIMWQNLSVTWGRSMIFCSFLQLNWLPWYNWNIVESGIKHHKLTNHPINLY
jgi:hypothetical protein